MNQPDMQPDMKRIIGRNRMTNRMTAHPASVGETYWQHRWMAHQYAWSLFGAACAALIHGFLPFLFINTASATIKSLNSAMSERLAPPPEGYWPPGAWKGLS